MDGFTGGELPRRLDVAKVRDILLGFLEQGCQVDDQFKVPPASDFEGIVKHVWGVCQGRHAADALNGAHVVSAVVLGA